MATSISFLLLYPCSVIRFLPCLLMTLIGEISCFDGANIRVNVACHPVTFNLKLTVASQIALEPKYQRSPHLSYVDFATIMLVYQKWGSVEISEPFKAVLVIAFKSQHYDMLISNQEMKHEIIRFFPLGLKILDFIFLTCWDFYPCRWRFWWTGFSPPLATPRRTTPCWALMISST